MAERRHIEFFGPDLARGPVLSGAPETASVQIASAIAQLRTPLDRSDTSILAHADFIRTLADHLFPDYAVQIDSEVGPLSGTSITTTIRAPISEYSVLNVWLADSSGGGLTATAPTAVSWSAGTVLQQLTAKKQYMILTTADGNATVTVTNATGPIWYWALARQGRVYYSTAMHF
jgi:hypothetical protein